MTALIDRKQDQVAQFGYAWTCRTRAVAAAAGAPEPDGR
jgi:hypothetical protein